MDPLFMAQYYFRRKKLEECAKICTELLQKNPYDQAAWFLKMRAVTEQTYVDEVEMDDEGIAEMFMEDSVLADVARPGTSLRNTTDSRQKLGTGQGIRPLSQSGRPLSGFLRPGSMAGRPKTMEQAIRTPRSLYTARPVTTSSGRHVRLGTASMLSEPDGPFVDVSKLNLQKYAEKPALAKALFEYMFHHENHVMMAHQLAALATEASGYKDWWWKIQLGKCYYRLGLYRDAEAQFKSALKHFSTVDMFLYLGKVYVKLDQPNNALDFFKKGLERFQNNTTLLLGIARIHEGLHDLDTAVTYYKEVLRYDATCVEAIACTATHFFYSEQPEIALRYYRRLFQMGIHTAEIFTNMGLCCFYAQHLDMALSCFQRALGVASDEVLADIWYNIGHVALAIGDSSMAYRCFKLAVTLNNDHAEAYNNIGVLEFKKDNGEQALACFQSSSHLCPQLYQPQYNTACIAEKIGNLHVSFKNVQAALKANSEHTESAKLLKELEQYFGAI